jgi:hypothetical protein
VNNKSDVKGFKALTVIKSEKEYITNDKSLRVLAIKKTDKKTNIYNRIYNFRPIKPEEEDNLNLILE